MSYRFRPPVTVEIVGVPAPDAQQRLEAAITVVADAIAQRAWDEAVAELEAEIAADDAARLAAGVA
jgi:hypothetical protein